MEEFTTMAEAKENNVDIEPIAQIEPGEGENELKQVT
jgi:hypothetical protein